MTRLVVPKAMVMLQCCSDSDLVSRKTSPYCITTTCSATAVKALVSFQRYERKEASKAREEF